MKRAAVLCLLLVTSIAAPRAQGTAPRMDGYPEPGAPPIINLLSAGSGPRTALRFAIPQSYKGHLDMSMQMSMSMEMGGASMPAVTIPTMTIGCDVAVTNVAANGDVSYTLAFTGATIAPDAEPTLAAALQGLDGEMKAIKGAVTVSNRGVTRDMKLDQGKSANSQFSQLLGQLSNQAQSLSLPLPEEEIGVGARWDVRQAIVNGGVQIFQRSEYELAAVDGKAATLNVKIEQTAPAQSLSNPALPPDATVRLLTMTGSGSGTTTIAFDSLLPTSTASMDSTTSMEISMGGSQQTMSTKASIKMSLAPKK